MACSMFPGDLEESVIWTEPLQARIPATVHLSQQPGLQTDPPGLDAHCEEHLREQWEEEQENSLGFFFNKDRKFTTNHQQRQGNINDTFSEGQSQVC